MIILNFGFMLWTAVQTFKANRRKKVIERRQQVQREYEQTKDLILANQSNLLDREVLPSIAETVNEDGSSQHKSQGGTSVAKLPQSLG